MWAITFALSLGSTMGCELISSVDRNKIDNSGGSGGMGGSAGMAGMGGMGGMAGMAGMGGTGGTPECAVAEDCPDPGNECLQRACTPEQTCVPAPVADGTAVAAQTPGDCQEIVCDGSGATKSQASDADLPNDGKECTDDACAAGVPTFTPLAKDTACGTGGALYCDGNGACVGCTDAAQCGTATDCSAPACNAGTCATDFTAPGTPIPMQTAGDCQVVQCDGLGGTKSVTDNADVTDDGNQCTEDVCNAGMATHPNSPSGKACTTGGGQKCNGAGACVECLTGADCTSLVCMAQACIAASCMDNVENANETDKDCGGADCAPCANGKGCLVGTDCTSKVCTSSVCQAPTCTDTTQNGTETDVDCGGGACAKCGPDKACNINSDCVGNLCTSNTCVPTCTDMVKNGTETDVDCGGSCAAKCATGKVCGGNADCQSGVCTSLVCQAPTCGDNVKNGNETDVDCGGPDCNDCADGKVCVNGGDCQSGVCTGSVCQTASCTDMVKNGTESDVDCGGGSCPTCANGKMCTVGPDCTGGNCVGGVCGSLQCSDGMQNGAETDVDCGGGTCNACANGKACLVNGDCTSNFCNGNVCAAPLCPNGMIDGAEQCDDNNGANGDGCSSTCTCEATQVVTVDPNPDVNIIDDDYDGTLATMACVPIPVSAQCTITSMTVTVGMAHTWIGDLTIKLVHPDNTIVTLLSRPGELEATDDGNDGVTGGDSSNLVKTHPITFQMGAAVSAEDMGATIANTLNVCQDDSICTFAPNNGAALPGDLTAFAGKKANGTWQFCASDSVALDTGSIDKVTLTINQ